MTDLDALAGEGAPRGSAGLAPPRQLLEDMAAAGSRWRGWLEVANEELANARADPASHLERPPLTSDKQFDEIMSGIREEDRQARERQPGSNNETRDDGARDTQSDDCRNAADPASRVERGSAAEASSDRGGSHEEPSTQEVES